MNVQTQIANAQMETYIGDRPSTDPDVGAQSFASSSIGFINAQSVDRQGAVL